MLTYPSPKPTLTLTETLAKCWLRGGVGGQNAETYNDFCKHSIRTLKTANQLFQVTVHVHPGHPLQQTTKNSFLMPKYSL